MLRFMALIACALACCVVQPALAQPVWEIGALGGINSGSLSADTENLASGSATGIGSISGNIDGGKTDGIAGLFVMVSFTDYLGARIEGLGTMKGGKGDVSGTILGTNFTGELFYKLNYVELPILFVGSWPASQNFTLRGFVGPAIDFLANAKIELKATTDSGASGSDEEDISEAIKGTAFNGVIGAEGAFTLGGVNLLLDVRYTLGFSNVMDDLVPFEIKTNTLSFMFGLGFPIRPSTAGAE